jgi:hypothetical protein
MELKLNREYALRHLFVAALMAGLCGWFGYDGFVKYPHTTGHDLYVSIEGAEPPENFDLDAFKTQKIKTQYGFTALTFAAFLAVALGVLGSARFKFAFDADGFTFRGERFGYGDIAKIDDRAWARKGIVRLYVKHPANGMVVPITLDAWHHAGVKDFYARVKG